MADEIHVGDTGTRFVVTVTESGAAVNIASATTRELIFVSPIGEKNTKPATLTTDGSDGKMEYVTDAADLDVDGLWKLQGHVVLPSGAWHTEISEFIVYPNL